jgi:phosphatidate cytidylyltransferase
MLILMGFAIVFSDVFAFVIGKFFATIHFFDKYKIAANISPNKTFAGVAGNILGAGFGIAVTRFATPMFGLESLIILAFLIGIGGLLGDLTESMVKRTFGAKDSGTLIPGHGGLLDRMDSAIRVIVIFYYYLVLFL